MLINDIWWHLAILHTLLVLVYVHTMSKNSVMHGQSKWATTENILFINKNSLEEIENYRYSLKLFLESKGFYNISTYVLCYCFKNYLIHYYFDFPEQLLLSFQMLWIVLSKQINFH